MVLVSILVRIKIIDQSLSKALGREVRLMKASLEKPSYEEFGRIRRPLL